MENHPLSNQGGMPRDHPQACRPHLSDDSTASSAHIPDTPSSSPPCPFLSAATYCNVARPGIAHLTICAGPSHSGTVR